MDAANWPANGLGARKVSISVVCRNRGTLIGGYLLQHGHAAEAEADRACSRTGIFSRSLTLLPHSLMLSPRFLLKRWKRSAGKTRLLCSALLPAVGAALERYAPLRSAEKPRGRVRWRGGEGTGLFARAGGKEFREGFLRGMRWVRGMGLRNMGWFCITGLGVDVSLVDHR